MSLAVPAASLGHWLERLLRHGVRYEGPTRRFDEQVLAFADPDGLLLEIVATARVDRVEPWRDGPVPAEHAIRGVHGVTIWEDGERGTAEFLTRFMGVRAAGEEGNRARFEFGREGVGTVVDLRRVPGFWAGGIGVGTVHHVAFRAASDEAQLVERTRLEDAGVDVTPVLDRQYFHSVYFREPGGVLFEIATDPPGFTLDEPVESLGSGLRLPPRFEVMREGIERTLPPLRLATRIAAPRGGRRPHLMATSLGFIHQYVPATRPGLPALLLLHGTGGNEDDLLPLGAQLLPGAALLSPRGQVLENGMPRFFRRLAEGVFDLDDLRRRTHELADFVDAARGTYDLGPAAPVAVGLSNGANVAAATMLLRPGTLGGGLLLRPMVPLQPDPLPALGGLPVQINAGLADPIVTPGQSDALATLLRRAGATVSVEWIEGGHRLTQVDLETGRRFLTGLSSGAR